MFPVDTQLRLKPGARVMMLQNNGSVWQNGTVGKVVKLGRFEGQEAVLVNLPAGEFWITRHLWEIIRYTRRSGGPGIIEEVVVTFSQFPMKLAWAVTIHVSQGMTFDTVRIDLQHEVFKNEQLYLALSRCRTLEGITLKTPIRTTDVKCHPRVKWFESVNNIPDFRSR